MYAILSVVPPSDILRNPAATLSRLNRHVGLVQEARAGLAKISTNVDTAAAQTNARPPSVESFGLPVGGDRGGSSSPDLQPSFPDSGLGFGPSPSPPPRPTPAPASVQSRPLRGAGPASRGAYNDNDADPKAAGVSVNANVTGAGEGEDEVEMEMERLVEWRDELLATGMYTPQNPIVSELNRRIAHGRQAARPLRRDREE